MNYLDREYKFRFCGRHDHGDLLYLVSVRITFLIPLRLVKEALFQIICHHLRIKQLQFTMVKKHSYKSITNPRYIRHHFPTYY